MAALLKRLDPSGPRSLVAPMVPLLAARGGTQLAAAVVAVLVARAVGPDRFGLFAGLTALASVVVGGSSSGLPVLALRRVASKTAARGFTRALCATALRMGAVATALTVLLAWLLYRSPTAAGFAVIASGAFVALTLLTTVSASASGNGRFSDAAAGELAGAGVTVAMVVLSLSMGLGIGGALASMAVGPLAGAVLIGRRVSGLEPGTPEQHGRLGFRELLPFIALGLASTGYLRLDAALLGPLTDASTLGLYAAAYRVLGVFSLIGSAFGTVFFARVAASPGDRRPVKKATLLLLGVVAVPAGLIFVFAPFLVTALFGPSYSGAAAPLRILMVSVLPWSLYWPSAHFLNASGRERQFAAILAVATAVDLAALTVLSARLGAAGAATAWLLAESVTLLLCILALRRPPQPAEPQPA